MHRDSFHTLLGFEGSERGYSHTVTFSQNLADDAGKLLAQQRHVLRLPAKPFP